jgi:CARDB
MPRSLLPLCVAGLACLALSSAAPAEPAPLVSVSLRDCREADPEVASFYGSMRSVAGATRVGMRFSLLERTSAGKFVKVEAPGLAGWHKSRVGARRFGYLQRVSNLDAGAAYRAVVSFRWYGRGGTKLRTTTRRSPVCEPRSELPNLLVNKISSRPAIIEGGVIYAAHVLNSGGDARDVAVQLRLDGQTLEERRLAILRAGETRVVEWTGGACIDRARAVVDPANMIGESVETDNVLAVYCPVPPE